MVSKSIQCIYHEATRGYFQADAAAYQRKSLKPKEKPGKKNGRRYTREECSTLLEPLRILDFKSLVFQMMMTNRDLNGERKSHLLVNCIAFALPL